MKILITGGSGYLGTHVRKYFDADDLSRRNGRDVLNVDDLGSVGNYDAVIHMAASLNKSSEDANDTFRTNVEGTVNVLERIKENAAFIFISTKDVYGCFADNYQEVPESCLTMYSGQSPLEWSKLIAEHYVDYYAHQKNFRSCIFRLSTPYAPGSKGNSPNIVGHLADFINLGASIRLPDRGRPIRDILHVDDLSAACREFLGSIIRHGTYNLGGGSRNSVSLNGLLKRMEAISGLQAVVDTSRPLPSPTPYNYVSDLSRVQQELGWMPQISIDEGLKTLF